MLLRERWEGKRLKLELVILQALNRGAGFDQFGENEIGHSPKHDLEIPLVPIKEWDQDFHILVRRSRDTIDCDREYPLQDAGSGDHEEAAGAIQFKPSLPEPNLGDSEFRGKQFISLDILW